jgi:hypothetical protein
MSVSITEGVSPRTGNFLTATGIVDKGRVALFIVCVFLGHLNRTESYCTLYALSPPNNAHSFVTHNIDEKWFTPFYGDVYLKK